jgi:hypothetical protein
VQLSERPPKREGRMASHREVANRTYVRYAAASVCACSGSRSYCVDGTRL